MNKIYTDEYKKQALELAISLNNISQAATQLGIRDSLIHAWKKKQNDKKTVPGKLLDIQIEINLLRKENAKLKKVNYILKSATAFFSQDHIK